MSMTKCITCETLYDPLAGPCEICLAIDGLRQAKHNRHQKRDKIMQLKHQQEKGKYWYEKED
jgi:hypothetical protein